MMRARKLSLSSNLVVDLEDSVFEKRMRRVGLGGKLGVWVYWHWMGESGC
jgi:hypothetical protein